MHEHQTISKGASIATMLDMTITIPEFKDYSIDTISAAAISSSDLLLLLLLLKHHS